MNQYYNIRIFSMENRPSRAHFRVLEIGAPALPNLKLHIPYKQRCRSAALVAADHAHVIALLRLELRSFDGSEICFSHRSGVNLECLHRSCIVLDRDGVTSALELLHSSDSRSERPF